MTNHRITTKLGERTRRLSLAVRLVDGFTRRTPRGNPRVRLADIDVMPVQNPSGYHVFLDLATDTATVRVGAGEYYLDVERPNITVLNHEHPDPGFDPTDPATYPVETITLTPTPAYPFPRGTTLIHGYVREADDGVPDAVVTVRDHDATTTTTPDGEFVLFLTNLTEDDIVEEDGTINITINDSDPVLDVDHPHLGTTSASVRVEENTRNVHTITY